MNKSDLSPIEKRVQKHLDTCFGITKSPRLILGVSGGADSMSLLHMLHNLGVQVHIVHLNYQKRGEASAQDAALVRATTNGLGLDCTISKVNPEEAQNKNFQQWAREIRYRAFEREAERVGADGIATAHHQDDQLETILQKIFRGGGLASWSAMKVWNGRLFRPLLEVSRQKIEAYCKLHHIEYRNDASNFSSEYARNFLRNDWLPQLEKHFPGWRANVLRIAEQARVFEASLEFILQQLMDEKDCLKRSGFLRLDDDLQKTVLLYYVKKIHGNASISRPALGELSELPHLQTGKSLQLNDDLKLLRDRRYFKLTVEVSEKAHDRFIHKKDLDEMVLEHDSFCFQLQDFVEANFDTTLYMDAACLSWPLHVRRWVAGDRFQPLGMSGHQTVAEHLTHRKIVVDEKNQAWVVESFEETICAVIFPPAENRQPPGTVAEQVKCTSSTQQCVTIQKNSDL